MRIKAKGTLKFTIDIITLICDIETLSMMTGLVLFSVSVSKVLAENTTCSLAGIRNGHGGQKTSSAVFIGMKMVGERIACAVLWK